MEGVFLPISPFPELVERADRSPYKIVLRDHYLGITATAGQLLHGVCFLRDKLQTSLLQNGMYDTGNSSEDKFVFLLAPPGWEYVVSMLTILSLGAATSAQSIVIRPEEMIHHMKLAMPLALLYSPAFAKKVDAIKALCAENDSGVNQNLPFVEIQAECPDDMDSITYRIESCSNSSAAQTGSLFFTSGTSGNQKGVVHSYQALLASARERIETWSLTENDVVLITKPGNWMGGIFGLLPSLMSGACLETCAGVFNPKWFWKRISQGGVSVFDIAPTGYDMLAQYFEEHIAMLAPAEQNLYVEGMVAVKVAGVTGSLLSPVLQKRWTDFRRGKPLLNLYGSTEVMLICNMRWQKPEYSDMCAVGPAVPGVEVKLVGGVLRLKAPTMFSRYISDDPTVSANAFDEDGFFKTGDCAEDLGDCYKLHGRASIDVLHFWGFTLYTCEIETALSALLYIANAIVFPVDDHEYPERVAAILQLKLSCQATWPSLETLRNDLTEKTGLMLFKQPTVVYWLREGEEITYTASGKVSKMESRKRFFGDDWRYKKGIEVLDLKDMEYWRMGGQC